jgi:hypothetical protein
MAAPWKPWKSHTPQWRAKAIASGMTRQRWDKYGELSTTTRKVTNPREYAQGNSVAAQRLARQREDIVQTLLGLTNSQDNKKAIRRMRGRINMMPDELVVKYHKVKPETHRRWARDVSKVIYVDGEPFNPSWYR